jgi:hypothetical protein
MFSLTMPQQHLSLISATNMQEVGKTSDKTTKGQDSASAGTGSQNSEKMFLVGVFFGQLLRDRRELEANSAWMEANSAWADDHAWTATVG